jgi:hypothetical protein
VRSKLVLVTPWTGSLKVAVTLVVLATPVPADAGLRVVTVGAAWSPGAGVTVTCAPEVSTVPAVIT